MGLERLKELIGHESDLGDVSRALYAFAGDLRAPVVGAMQLTCSDESERECIAVFQREFADPLLPSLKFGERAVFRIANLGARYEQGAVNIADEHYAAAPGAERFKLMVVKVNSHVSVETTVRGPRFGSMRRYGTRSTYCGALHALMAGAEQPFVRDLAEVFRAGGRDRLAYLLHEQGVSPPLRALVAAVVQAGLQARRVVDDYGKHGRTTPTLLVVLSCVTFNREARDTELVCGIHLLDRRTDEATLEYHGLGDDPAAITVRTDLGRIVLEI